jgi:hypothetical protein
MVIGCGFFAPFGAVLVARTRRMESDTPVFTYLQFVSFGATLAVTSLVPMSFALAAFRPEQDPAITEMLNDTAWFLLVYIWPLFTVWPWSLAAPILLAPKGTATFPRWVGHLSLWCGLLFASSFLVDHLKTGPLPTTDCCLHTRRCPRNLRFGNSFRRDYQPSQRGIRLIRI